jgi:undecaprenyl diphosphate synthase
MESPQPIAKKPFVNPIPLHVAIIMDGNGRWAKKRHLPTILGHREGASTLKRLSRHAASLGVKFLTVYAFSTENWCRPREWVQEMMGLLRYYLKNEVKEISQHNIQLKMIGDRTGFDQDIQKLIKEAEEKTAKNTGLTLIIALNYGGRKEIVKACQEISQKILSGQLTPETIDETLFSKFLYTCDIPDPDLLIRSSGEFRLSNYLLWQLAYAELVFSDKLWPDFSEDDLENAITTYHARERRFGTVIAN